VERSFGTIRSHFVPVLLHYLRARGRDSATFARAHGIPAEVAPLDPVPVALFVQLVLDAEHDFDEPFLGLRMAQSVPRGGYGVLEFTTRTAPDVRTALTRAVRYQRLISDRADVALDEHGPDVSLTHRLAHVPAHASRHVNEFCIAAFVASLRDIAPNVTLTRVAFSHPRPAQIDALVTFFGTDRIEFGQERDGFTFSAALLDQPIASADPALLAVLDAHASHLLASLPATRDFVGSVRDAIGRELLDGTPDIARVAQKLHMSARTLQRRLAELGTAFQDLVDTVRHELAARHLQEGTLAISEVAYLLGYSDPRAFLRAFRRWTNTTPGEYRERHLRLPRAS
jgi:AraC-like DNA-binding protein